MTSPTRTVLVAGATGKQGRAFIEAVLHSQAESVQDIRIVALTRNPNSPSSKELSHASDRVQVVRADLDQPDTVRKAFQDASQSEGGLWGVFVVLAFPGLGADATGEERQGKAHHLIFSSVERGDEGYDDKLTLDRLAKVQIERHIRSLTGLRWTFLRPAFFMENFDGTIGSITNTVLKCGLQKTTKLQLIAADDIGHVALGVFQASDEYASKAVVVIGDALTTQELNEAHVRGAGKPLGSVPNFLGKALLAANKHTKGLISDMERVHNDREALPESSAVLIAQCRTLYPELQTFEVWAKNRGRKKERKANWNNVTIGELATGKR
ncbi:NAD(P)-binding protein [Schizopora paradoxa]|uniref:NAD(P)-binding protein n=1 Tax=Schizopora paradoxa TaxID=27342 RepID=A0A0H2S6N1_9AGAM|nr:NAD(P)-binding protein [Schizopora paradoxa]